VLTPEEVLEFLRCVGNMKHRTILTTCYGVVERHPAGVEKWFTDLPRARVATDTGTHSIWISEQLRELGHEVIVVNVRELRAISHSDRRVTRWTPRRSLATPGSIRRSCDRSPIARLPDRKP
jgi:xanthine dehydrogenase iron-sulfur cluster and FAD-binding subunit A